MWWVKAPFLTCVQLHALCFSSAASKKAGSAKDSWKSPFPFWEQNSTWHHTTVHLTCRAKECSSGGCKIPKKTFTWFAGSLCQSCVLPAVKSLQSYPLILMIYCCRESLEKCSWQSEKWTGWQTDSLHRHSRKWCAEHKEAWYSREIFGKPHGKAY